MESQGTLKRLSMLPGPSYVPESIMNAMLDSNVYHRSESFHKVYNDIQLDLQYLFKTKRPVFTITSSGTGGLESIVSNLLRPGQKILALINGYFSQELASILEAFRMVPVKVNVPWESGISTSELEKNLRREKDIKAVAVAYVETSTGSRAPLEELEEVCERFGVQLIVDAESAIGGEAFSFDDWKIGACSAGTQKCICSPPGVSLVSLSQDAWNVVVNNDNGGFYFNLRKYLDYSKRNETPFTPALPLFFALRESLRFIRAEGIEKRIARHASCASRLRDGLEKLGLVPYVPIQFCSNVTTAVDLSNTGLSATQVVQKLSTTFGIEIATGMGPLKEKLIRIGTMGEVSVDDVELTLDALGHVFKK